MPSYTEPIAWKQRSLVATLTYGYQERNRYLQFSGKAVLGVMAQKSCCLALMQTSLVWDCTGRRLCLTARQYMETARKMEFKTRGMLDTMSGEMRFPRVLYGCAVLGVAHGPPPAFPSYRTGFTFYW